MLYFWPHAITEDGQEIWTQDCTPDYSQAVSVFENWEKVYGSLKSAKIDAVDEDKNIHTIYFRKEWMQIPQRSEFEIV